MKLYYTPGACSLSPHIVARELGIALDLERVDLATRKTETGADFTAINAKGYVPALKLDDGSLLTEGPAIVQYLADLKPAGTLLPAVGKPERYRVLSLLTYVNSELHKTFGPLFYPTTLPAVRDERIDYLMRRYEYIEKELQTGQHLTGANFTLADAYLFVVTNWSGVVKIDLSRFSNLMAFQKRVAERPAVRAAMVAEGLIK
jgi:glutathione S-transferase